MTSPVRLGVCPAATPTPTGVLNQRFKALSLRAGALGCVVCFAPHHLFVLSVCECGATGCHPPLRLPCSPPLRVRPSQFICTKCGAAGSTSGLTALPRLSHTLPVSVPPRQPESSPPQLPVSDPPTGLDECSFLPSLVSDLLAVRFSVSSGCSRRRSVSTYAAILVPRSTITFSNSFFYSFFSPLLLLLVPL